MLRTIGAIAGTTIHAGGEVADAVGAAAPVAARTVSAADIDADAALGAVNERLRAEGKPAVTADELRMASQDAIRRAIREGRFDRDQVVAALSRNTALSRQDALDIASRVEVQLAEARVSLDEAGDRATATALTAADKTGKALLGAAVGLILGLLTAVGGAILGTHRRAVARDPVVVEERTVTP
jgi:hypothetical protein